MLRSRRAFPARLAAAASAIFVLAAPAGATEKLVDGIAAQVGSDIVLYSEVMDMVEGMEARMRAAGAPDSEIAKLRAEGLERMIEWRLIEQVVRKAELFATDAELDNTIEAIAKENGLTVPDLERSVVAQGMTLKQYREQIKRELERSKVIDTMVRSQIRVGEDELHRAYAERFAKQHERGEEVHLRQILVTHGGDTGRSKADACGAVRAALERVRGGEPFEKVAGEVSLVAPDRGGDIGWLHRDSMAGWMTDVLGPLTAGQNTEVIELPYACVLMQLVERKQFEPLTYEEAKPQLREEVFGRHMEEKYREWMEQLRAHTYIERRGHFAEAADFGQPVFGTRSRGGGGATEDGIRP